MRCQLRLYGLAALSPCFRLRRTPGKPYPLEKVLQSEVGFDGRSDRFALSSTSSDKAVWVKDTWLKGGFGQPFRKALSQIHQFWRNSYDYLAKSPILNLQDA